MKFSILIANYNNGKFFKDCYDSIIAQAYKSWEVIIVDDKSTDNSLDLISTTIGKDDRFKLFLNDENKGCGYTKRRCAELADGDIMGFVDPDDALLPNALQLMVEAHEARPDVSLVHSRLHYCDSNLNINTPTLTGSEVTVSPQFTNLDYAVTHFSSFKRTCYIRTEGIHPFLKRAVDQDLYLKLSETGSFFFLDKGLYKYRIHDNGISSHNAQKAFYNHLKVIAWAEVRRKIDLENEVAPFISLIWEQNTSSDLPVRRPGILTRGFRKLLGGKF